MSDLLAEIAGQIATLLGYDGAAFRNVLVDALGHLQVDTLSSALPAGAATEATLALVEAATADLPDLIDALASYGFDQLRTDVISSALPAGAATAANQTTLLARIPERVHTYKAAYRELVLIANAAAGANALNGASVPAGEVWCITSLATYNATNISTYVWVGMNDTSNNLLVNRVEAPAVGVTVDWSGHLWLTQGHYIKAVHEGCVLNDRLTLYGFGYKMSV